MANQLPFLQQGQFLATNDSLISPSEYYRIFLQGDGNLVVYRQGGTALWSTGKTGAVGDYCAVLEDGGLLNIYPGATPPAPGAVPFFSSGKTGSSPNYYAVVQDDGNFCIYPGNDPTDQQSDTPIYTFNHWDPVVNVEVSALEYEVDPTTGGLNGTLTDIHVGYRATDAYKRIFGPTNLDFYGVKQCDLIADVAEFHNAYGQGYGLG